MVVFELSVDPPQERKPRTNSERQRLFRQRHADDYRARDRARKVKARSAEKAKRELGVLRRNRKGEKWRVPHPGDLYKWNVALVRKKVSINQGLFLKNADRGKGICWQLFDLIDNSRSLSLEHAEAFQRAACKSVFSDPDLADVYLEETCRSRVRLAYQCQVRPEGHGPDGDEWDNDGFGVVSVHTERIGPGADDDEDDYDPIAGWLEFEPITVREMDSLSERDTADFDASVTDRSLEEDI
jgi:hypothetical protein